MADLRDLIPDLDEQLADDEDVDRQLDEFMDEQVIPEWVKNSPKDTGDYIDSIKVTKRAHRGRGQVGATDEAANIIEYGSEDTPAFAPRAKTEAHFNHGLT
ncbi:hypothetical protein MMRN_38430 [Mycobacterium marinum]|uniref:hypothetical protein n=1 Tax=Mycobacterium marinum TaxID=1781 RepID=UPI000CD9B2ED|nr:hypothetical protein [Mycobacterium marinum]AXN50938.1 hypothetical protein CCUG20998_03536 [Mycobacterium marinum]RFZ25464.1 hypothetical protein DSM43519_01650 [Mycobacterium marinum]RFZ28351.1 hypothetical protein DSM44344_01396 [Mycobacterium marinum]RFZ33822.1 hypothetical protein NCTC2275_02668 [Mycobacterium marinum]WOR02989.1 hypothetical protein QDR78_17405 [Mycobacterium marinum]